MKVAKTEPLRYGKNGELLIDYEQTEEHRRRSVASAGAGAGKASARRVEDVNRAGTGSGESSAHNEKTETV